MKGLFNDLYDLDFEANPSTWDSDLEKRQIDFATAVALTPEALRKKLWEKVRNDIVRKNPLSQNVNALVGRCRKANSAVHDGLRTQHRISLERVEEIDKLRQSLVHRPKEAAPIAITEDVLTYLYSAVVMVAELVANCLLGLEVDLSYGGVADLKESREMQKRYQARNSA